MAWIWVIVGGVFILTPGIIILYFYNLWNPIWMNTGPGWALTYGVMLGPPLLFVGVGVAVIAIGTRRYREARAS